MGAASLVHLLHTTAQLPGHARFVRAMEDVESVQRQVLGELLAASERTEFGSGHGLSRSWSAEDVASRLPVTTWTDWEAWVKRQQAQPTGHVLCAGCRRFEPTSGSTAQRKWIPYPAAQLAQFDRASSPWLYDLARLHPGILRGRHYWSLSWLPDELRNTGTGARQAGDDLQLLPWWKRRLLSAVMAVTQDVARLSSVDDTMFETVVRLASASDLSVISVWSPTFGIEVLRRLARERERVAERLSRGGLPVRAGLLRSWDGTLDASFFRELWPDLSLVSAWDTGSSAGWARSLAALLPQAAFQGKGVWATEGVVTIPFRGRYPLAVRSHFYEFRCLSSGRFLPAWRLELGMEVQPILSTGSGFWRYALEDRLEVTDFLGPTPCLRFVSRLSGTDLVGEKLDAGIVSRILEDVQREIPIQCVSLLARPGAGDGTGLPHYVLLAGGKPELTLAAAEAVERHLAAVHHYGLARQLHQLGPASALVLEDPLPEYFRRTGGDAASGSRKIEPVVRWKEP